jgi:hypothetical protein
MMKLKAIFVALAVAAATSSAALAAPAKGKPPLTGPGCKPQVSVILKGTVAVAPGASPSLPFGLKITVTKANEQGEAYVKASQPIEVVPNPVEFDGRSSVPSHG